MGRAAAVATAAAGAVRSAGDIVRGLSVDPDRMALNLGLEGH